MAESEKSRVAVLGAGTWGIVLASLLARQGHSVTAWDIAPDVIDALRRDGKHPKLEGFAVAPEIALTSDLGEAVGDTSDLAAVVFVVPSHGMRKAAERCRELGLADSDAALVLCSKGLEEGTELPMADVVEDVMGAGSHERIVILSGPSHAEEVAQGIPTTVCAAGHSMARAELVQALFSTDTFRVYTHDDILGAEVGASLKNVIAIAAGVLDGMGLGDNSRAALITRGLAEIVRLGVAMGARQETFSGLTGMGDLIVTCASQHSRNHRFGELLAKGRTKDRALEEIGMVVEGLRTVRSAVSLAEKHGVDMPITREVHAVTYEDKSPRDALRDLMQRDPKPEIDKEARGIEK